MLNRVHKKILPHSVSIKNINNTVLHCKFVYITLLAMDMDTAGSCRLRELTRIDELPGGDFIKTVRR